MKTFLIIGLLSFSALFGKLYASEGTQRQPRQSQEEREAFRQRVQDERVAFFTERLALTPAEVEQFWTLFNTFQTERDRLNTEIRRRTHVRQAEGERRVFDVSNLSDADVQQLVDNRARIIDLERQFHNDLSELLSPRQVLAFYEAERRFQQELINSRNRSAREQNQRAREQNQQAREQNQRIREQNQQIREQNQRIREENERLRRAGEQ